MYETISISLNQLVYQSDPKYATTPGLKSFWYCFLNLEKTLPEVGKIEQEFVEKRFPRVVKVYESIKQDGLKNPLIVRKVDYSQILGAIYKVEVGNQRLCCARAVGLQEVPCQIIPPGRRAKDIQDESQYIYIEGTEGGVYCDSLHKELL